MKDVTSNDYQAKQFYQASEVARKYEEERFTTWHGRLAHKIEADALEFVVKRYFETPASVLDVPCGTGRLLESLVHYGFEVQAADISEEMLQLARKRFAERKNISFGIVDAENMPFKDNTFDYLTSYRFMCHLPPEVRDRVLGEMVRVTRKVLAINYHFDVLSPLHFFNKLVRRSCCSPWPLTESEFRESLEQRQDVHICEIRKLSWYERSSALVVLRKLS